MATGSSLLNKSIGGGFAPQSWGYTSKYTKKPPKDGYKYISNSSVLTKKAKLNPDSKESVGITSKMDDAIHFNLNMGTGHGGFEKNFSYYFDRFYSVYPEHELSSLCQYVFFVRPDLNILDTNRGTLLSLSNSRKRYTQAMSPNNNQFLRYMHQAYPYLLDCLVLNGNLDSHDFIPFLTGRVESINLPDYTIKDYKMTQPYSGYNLPYASHALESMTGGEFEVIFRDDDEMRILKFFQTWAFYINAVTRNMLSPKMKYIRNNRADYCTSIYVITCKPNAEEIVHWIKYTGAFPVNVPHSNLSFNLRGAVNNKLSIKFDYFHQEPLDPLSIIDFNKNAHIKTHASKVSYIPVYHSDKIGDIGFKDIRSKVDPRKKIITGESTKFYKNAPVSFGTGNGLAGCPFVCRIGKKYYLRWKKINLSPIAKN